MITDSPSRRRFLSVLAHGGAIAGAACMGFGCGVSTSASVDAGNVSALPVDTLRAISGESVAIGRDAKGVYAMTMICPHEQCDMETNGSISTAGVSCNCHGSKFDANGAVVNGPANAPLAHYLVTVDSSGQLTIETTQTVAATTRLAVG